MQRLFAEETSWNLAWMPRVLPKVYRLVAAEPALTVFTRFVPVNRPEDGGGSWRRYYERWPEMTLRELGPEMVDLVPELRTFVPPAEVFDKHVYSPWFASRLHMWLQERGCNTLIISGGETDVCVLSTVLGAVDRGYRVVLAADALCSSSDATHDASLTLYRRRFGQQVELATTELILENWR